MMRAYLKDSFYWLHLFCFKLRTFERVAEKLSRRQTVAVFLKLYPWLFLTGLILLTVVGLACDLAGVPFNWQRALSEAIKVGPFVGLFSGLFFVLFSGLFGGLFSGLIGGLASGLFVGLFGWLFPWLGVGLFGWLVCGLFLGLGVRLFGELPFGLFFWLSVGLGSGLLYGLIIWLIEGQSQATRFAAVYFPVMLTSLTLVFGRPYYWPFHLVQLWRARHNRNWLARFRQSPVHWDETIGLPLPWLSNWLFQIAKDDRGEGLDEVLWVAAERPFQRKAAQKALLKLAAHDLRQITTVAQIAQAGKALEFLPSEDELAPRRHVSGRSVSHMVRHIFEYLRYLFEPLLSDDELAPHNIRYVARHLPKLAALAQDYLLRHTPNGQHKALLDLQSELQSFQKAMALLPAPTGHEFQQIAAQWQTTVNTAEAELRARLPFENPFIAGNPLLEHEENLFKGRHDLVVKLEEAIFGQRPALLLYGRRRTGKTSTLLNLPRLMSSQFVPVFIDCQNARWGDSDAMFCYHLARALHDELAKRKLAEGLAQPQKSEFEVHAFTRLDEFLDELEAHSRRIGKEILLTFDEYERLEEGIRDGKLSRAVLNHIRAIVQHRQRLIVLFSGSHRFEELPAVNWSDYLINVQTLHLSFLAREEARELIEHPTPEFALGYEPGMVDRILDLTHSQPYLVQALGSEIVNLINSQKRKKAMQADLDLAIERVLGTAEAYFENNWRECSPAEQAMLCALAMDEAASLTTPEWQAALQGLSRKELVEQRGKDWRYSVELFRCWVMKNRVPAFDAEPVRQIA